MKVHEFFDYAMEFDNGEPKACTRNEECQNGKYASMCCVHIGLSDGKEMSTDFNRCMHSKIVDHNISFKVTADDTIQTEMKCIDDNEVKQIK